MNIYLCSGTWRNPLTALPSLKKARATGYARNPAKLTQKSEKKIAKLLFAQVLAWRMFWRCLVLDWKKYFYHPHCIRGVHFSAVFLKLPPVRPLLITPVGAMESFLVNAWLFLYFHFCFPYVFPPYVESWSFYLYYL